MLVRYGTAVAAVLQAVLHEPPEQLQVQKLVPVPKLAVRPEQETDLVILQ